MVTQTTQLSVVENNANNAPAEYTTAQRDLIKRTVAAGTSEEEFELFVEVCRMTGLNPFAKQIYAIMRNAGKDEHGHWVKRMTIQTGIDGYRLLAARTGALAGIDDAEYDDEDAKHPAWGRVTVWRLVQGQRMPFTAKARWSEYAATDKDEKLTGQWGKMPYLMLGKCAEALALRKAFPAELSGVYTAEEMEQADNPPTPYVESAPSADVADAPRRARAPIASGAHAWLTDDSYDPMADVQLNRDLETLGISSMEQKEAILRAIRDKFPNDYSKRRIKACVAAKLRVAAPATLEGVEMGAPGN